MSAKERTNKMTSIDFTKTSTYADLYHYWNSEDYELDAINRELSYIQPIDRDQAVDDEGHAVYDEYVFYKIDECHPDRGNSFTAEQIEQFAQTW
jgi:hypothetical protein